MNKRDFVLATGGTLVGGGVWAAVGQASTPVAAPEGGLAGWQGRVGQRFDVFGTTEPTQLLLQRVISRDSDAQTSQFTLVFASVGGPLAAGTQVLRGPNAGAMALYLEPTGAVVAGHPALHAHFCQLV